MTTTARNFVKDVENVGQGKLRTLTSPGCTRASIDLIKAVKSSDRSGDINKREIRSRK